MEYNEVQLKDFKKAELELSGEEQVFISQKDKTRNTLLSKIKDFIIGTNTMGTTATDVTGAVKELNDKIGSVEKEGSVIAHLNEKLSLFIGETLPDEKDDKTLYFKVTDTINISNNGPIKASPTMGLKEV